MCWHRDFTMKRRKNGNHFLAKSGENIISNCRLYGSDTNLMKTDAESTLSYEMILAMEALDENYVDENGQVVMQKQWGHR